MAPPRKKLTFVTDEQVTDAVNNDATMSSSSHRDVNRNIKSFVQYCVDNDLRIGILYNLLFK